MADLTELKFYFAYTSPFTYLAMAPAYELERTHHVRLRFIPYGVNIRRVYGDTPTRSHRDDLKVRYLYLDVRRFARERGLVIYSAEGDIQCAVRVLRRHVRGGSGAVSAIRGSGL